jgi:hypothetical protein
MLKLSAVLETCQYLQHYTARVIAQGFSLCSIIDRVDDDDDGGVRITKRRTNIRAADTIHISNIEEAFVRP